MGSGSGYSGKPFIKGLYTFDILIFFDKSSKRTLIEETKSEKLIVQFCVGVGVGVSCLYVLWNPCKITLN